MSANLGPYLIGRRIEEERRQRKADIIGNIVPSTINTFAGVEQVLFALDENRRAKAREKLENLTMLGTMYDWDKLPSRAVNEWGVAFKQSTGVEPPRDPTSGNVIPPANMEKREKDRLWAGMTDEEKKKVLFPGAFPDVTKVQQLKWKEYIDTEKLKIERIRAAADMARATRPRDSELPSGYVLDASGYPVEAKPGEPQITNGRLKNADVVKNFDYKRELDRIKIEAGRRALEQLPTWQTGMIRSMALSKDPGIRARGWKEADDAIQAEGGEPLGPMPPPETFQDKINQLFGKGSAQAATPPKAAMRKDIKDSVQKLREQMREATAKGEYDKARDLRTQIINLEQSAEGGGPSKEEINRTRASMGLPPL